MSRQISARSDSFRLLLYLEWLLLGMAVLTQLLPSPRYQVPQLPLLSILTIATFGVMGLKLPMGRLVTKVAYTGLEFGLILLPIVLDSRSIRFFPLLCLVVVIRSCQIFAPPGRLIVAASAFLSFLLTLFLRDQSLSVIKPPVRPMMPEQVRFTVLNLKLNALLTFGLTLMFVLLLINALLAERQSREQLAIANEQLRKYALRIEDQATLQERNRIARDIHDSLGHSLTALNLQLETAIKLWQTNPTKAETFLIRAKQLGSKALQDVRQSVSAMRSELLQARTLLEAIALLAEEFHNTTGVLPTCKICERTTIPDEVKTAIYRIVQEALTNISRYAAATEVKIQLTTTSTDLCLAITDNGRGFNLEQNTTGFGLQSMRDRTQALGGKLMLDSAPNAGCRITAIIPLPRLLS